jgi:glutaminyl-peptide cyclotransferase
MKRNNILIAIVAIVILIPIVYFSCDNEKPNHPVDEQPAGTPIATLTPVNINEHTHDSAAFCEGLEFYNGLLYEGTGHNGGKSKTFISTRNMATSKPDIKVMQGTTVWGEGITILKDTLYQLTYTEGKAFSYDAKTFKPIKEFSFKPEGWGMTNDGTSLIVSNGSAVLTFYNPKTFTPEKTIQVSNNIGLVEGINELEYVEGFIYANIHMTNTIIKIDVKTGKVVAVLDGTSLAMKGQGGNGDNLMNGIAYNKQSKSFFITGKNWNKLIEFTMQ